MSEERLTGGDILAGINAACAGVQHMAAELALSERTISMLAGAANEEGRVAFDRIAGDNREALANVLRLTDRALQFMGDYLSGIDAVEEQDIALTTPIYELVRDLKRRCREAGLLDRSAASVAAESSP